MAENDKNIWSFSEIVGRLQSYFVSIVFILLGGSLMRIMIINTADCSVFILVLGLSGAGFLFYFGIIYICMDFESMIRYNRRKNSEEKNILDDVFIKEDNE